jgi:predicted HTH transcriptional regulator
MKSPSEWDETDILELALSKENDGVEFKGRKEIDTTLPGVQDIHRANLAKALSALVNFGGGVLILGINNKDLTIDDGGISNNIKGGTKEWLENILPPLTDPPLHKFNVFEISGNKAGSTILQGRAIYVLEIKESP